jgi:hypothetical protein
LVVTRSGGASIQTDDRNECGKGGPNGVVKF